MGTVAYKRKSGKRVERRREPRWKPEGLLAHYWTGGLPTPRIVGDISLHGAAILASDVYYPGTVIRIAFEDVAPGEESPKVETFAGVWAKVLRNVDGGFSVGFIFESRTERLEFQRFLQGLRRRSMDETNGNGNANQAG